MAASQFNFFLTGPVLVLWATGSPIAISLDGIACKMLPEISTTPAKPRLGTLPKTRSLLL
jgi:hypothetical protein